MGCELLLSTGQLLKAWSETGHRRPFFYSTLIFTGRFPESQQLLKTEPGKAMTPSKGAQCNLMLSYELPQTSSLPGT